MVGTIIFFIGALVLYNFRAWVIRHITKHHQGQRIWLHVLIVGIFSTLLIWAFPKLLARTGINQEAFINSLDYPTIGSYAIYLLICGLCMYVVYVHHVRGRHFLVRIIVFLLLFAGIASAGLLLHLPAFIIYFSLVAFGEEFIKYAFGYSLFRKLEIHYTDLLLFCLISGFAFAFIENGMYARYAIKPHMDATLPEKIQIAIKVLVQRGIINVAVHALFTGIIGRFTLRPIQQEQSKLKIIFGIMLGVGIHAVFNTMVSRGMTFIMPLVVFGAYIVISFILYRSDSLFNAGLSAGTPHGDGTKLPPQPPVQQQGNRVTTAT